MQQLSYVLLSPNAHLDALTSLAFGYFNSYGNVARKDTVDYVIHLGDYIYEYKDGDYGSGKYINRVPQPDKEIYSL